MALELVDFDLQEEHFSFSFSNDDESFIRTISFEFDFQWSHKKIEPIEFQNESELERYNKMLEGFQMFNTGKPFTSRYIEESLEGMLRYTTFGVANTLTRELFRQVVGIWASFKKCPLEVRLMEHPQYHLVSLVYNEKVIETPIVVELIKSVLDALATSELDELAKPQEESESTLELEDLANPNEVVEFVLDSEINELAELNKRMRDEPFYEEMNTGEIVEEEVEND